MTSDGWARLQELFHAAADLPRAEQAAYVRAACGDDDALRLQVCALLDEDARADSLLDRDLGFVSAVAQRSSLDHEGRMFGPYRIRHRLGEGGMGVVFLAERADVGSVVAIKVSSDAWVSPSRRERFLSERRTLARLTHPSIARLYDADTLDDGTPWFVMEYVEGATITAHCAARDCALEERLRLFREACEAVRYAHAQAVIHRDLKPSNVLVKADGTVRLLDFGIAKQLDPSADAVERTVAGERLLTPAYAAPEHLLGEPAGVHTDVYSLGVLLFELLTGRRPFEPSTADPRELARTILEREPPRPSSVAIVRASRRAAWADLDALCSGALHRDVRRRYASVEALIADLDRFSAGLPLAVRPDTLRYRTGKFVVRHRRAVAATAAVACAGVGLSVAFAVRLARARDDAVAEAARTARVQAFMLNLFAGGDDSVGPPDDLRVVELIDRGVREAGTLAADPPLQAELFVTLGALYRKLGKLERADELLERARAAQTARLGPAHRDVAETFVALAQLRADQARYEDAECLARDGLRALTRTLPDDHPAVARALSVLGRVLEDRGNYEEAARALERAVRLQSAAGESSPDLAASLAELANVHFYAGRFDASELLNRRVLAMHRRTYGEHHPLVADTLINLGAASFEKGAYADAELRQREALAIVREWHGPEHPATASALTLLAQSLAYQERYEEAAALLEPALAIATAAFGDDHPRVASVLQRMGRVALGRGALDEAEACFARTADLHRGTLGDDHHLIANALSNLGSVYLAKGDDDRAASVLTEAVERYARALPADHTHTAIARIKLGRALLRARRFDEARSATNAGYEVLRRTPDRDATWIDMARTDLDATVDVGNGP